MKRSLTTYRSLLKKFEKLGHLKETSTLIKEFITFAKEQYTEEWLSNFTTNSDGLLIGDPLVMAIAILTEDISIMESMRKKPSTPVATDTSSVVIPPNGEETINLPGFDENPETFSPLELLSLVEGGYIEDEEEAEAGSWGAVSSKD